MKLLLQARKRSCDRQSRRSALRHTARVCRRASRLRVSVSLHVCTLSRRIFMNNAGQSPLERRLSLLFRVHSLLSSACSIRCLAIRKARRPADHTQPWPSASNGGLVGPPVLLSDVVGCESLLRYFLAHPEYRWCRSGSGSSLRASRHLPIALHSVPLMVGYRSKGHPES